MRLLGLWATLIYRNGRVSYFDPEGISPYRPVKVKPFDGVIVDWEGFVSGKVSVEDMPYTVEPLLELSHFG